MSFFSKLNNHNIQLLASQIAAKGGKVTASVDSIIDNLAYLTETGKDREGNDMQFIPLNVRRALATLCDEGRIIFKVEPSSIRWTADDDAVSLGGYLYLVSPDGKERIISSFACGGCAREDVYRNDSYTNPERKAMMLSTASAKAESNAYYNAGIGIEYKGGDIFDLEAMEKEIPAPEPIMPETKSIEERKTRSRRKKAEAAAEPAKTETVEQPKAEESTPSVPEVETKASEPAKTEVVETKASEPAKTEVVETPSLAENTTPTVTADDGKLTYEDAIKEVLDIGQYKGQTIAVILSDPRTARNAVWVYNHEPQEGRDPKFKAALEVAIDGYNNGILRNYMNK